MIQPAGYIRIITEELTENDRPVFREAVPRIEHVAVGLPLLHLRKPAPGDPDKGLNQKTLRTSSSAMRSAEWRWRTWLASWQTTISRRRPS